MLPKCDKNTEKTQTIIFCLCQIWDVSVQVLLLRQHIDELEPNQVRSWSGLEPLTYCDTASVSSHHPEGVKDVSVSADTNIAHVGKSRQFTVKTHLQHICTSNWAQWITVSHMYSVVPAAVSKWHDKTTVFVLRLLLMREKKLHSRLSGFSSIGSFYAMFYGSCKFSNPEACKIHSVSLIRFQRSIVINLKMSLPLNFWKIDFLKMQQTAAAERCRPLQTHKGAAHHSSHQFNLGDSRRKTSLTSHSFNIC